MTFLRNSHELPGSLPCWWFFPHGSLLEFTTQVVGKKLSSLKQSLLEILCVGVLWLELQIEHLSRRQTLIEKKREILSLPAAARELRGWKKPSANNLLSETHVTQKDYGNWTGLFSREVPSTFYWLGNCSLCSLWLHLTLRPRVLSSDQDNRSYQKLIKKVIFWLEQVNICLKIKTFWADKLKILLTLFCI